MENIKIYTLSEIADWQLDNKSEVKLPSIQREFVWKAKQIEDLWDSILRGYPIGSFLLSDTESYYDLLDGQQRGTAIFLGYYNPFENQGNIKTWSIKKELPVLWIDISPKNKPVNSKYLFRVITQSHPWGYQAVQNDKKLSVSDRRKALEIFRKNENNVNAYTLFRNTNVFPYDCAYPIPFSFFIIENDAIKVIEKIEKYLPNDIKTKYGEFENKEEFIKKLKGELKKDLEDIIEKIKDIDKVKIGANIIKKEVINEESEQEDPTLFVRINSSGTPLSQEDLIYSIYKSIFPQGKQLVENIGLNFISPAQVLSLIIRVITSQIHNHSYVKKMNVKEFQQKMKDKEFSIQLKKMVQENEIKPIVEKAIEILSLKNNSLFDKETPPVIIKSFIRSKPDLFLFLIYWLYIHKKDVNEDICLRITAKLFTFWWFDFGNIPKLWNEQIENENFWNENINDFCWWDGIDGIHFLIPPDLLKKYYAQSEIVEKFRLNQDDKWNLMNNEIGREIKDYFDEIKGKKNGDEESNQYFSKFIERIKNNKNLILLAQREFINQEFQEYNQIEDIEDTNTPWDWDHIYPSDWVYNKKNCNQGIRDWNNTNGNLRVISLEQNRSESNNLSPKIRLKDEEERKKSFISDKNWEYWQKIEERIYEDSIENHFYAITNRMISIYEKYWNNLKIDSMLKV